VPTSAEANAAGRRAPLTRERVLLAAVELADRGGIAALSMRRLGQDLGVEAMALYRHVRDKDDLLDGVVDLLVGQIGRPGPGGAWGTRLRAQLMAARRIMLIHPWARRVLEDRGTTGPAMLSHVDSILGILSDGGFSLDLAHHALHVLGSRIYGFERDMLGDSGQEPGPEPDAAAIAAMAVRYPNAAALAEAASHGGALGPCDDDVEFAFGLDLVLEGLERRRAAGSRGTRA
jgi:AcrR family transcriptional regulator